MWLMAYGVGVEIRSNLLCVCVSVCWMVASCIVCRWNVSDGWAKRSVERGKGKEGLKVGIEVVELTREAG